MIEKIEEFKSYQLERMAIKEDEKLVMNMLSKFLSLDRYYNKWKGFKTESNKVSGYIEQHAYKNTYSIKADNLTPEQLINLSVFIKGLK